MASDFDNLIADLQYDLALTGEEGLSLQELEARIRHYYDRKNASIHVDNHVTHADLLFSDEPPASRTVVTDHIVNSAWEWLARSGDVQIQRTALSDNAESTARLVSSTEQLWQAVAGHSPDPARVKGLEFPLLHLIAKHGRAGISQPDLVKLSGQDKRSVPQRTDRLAKNGYIIKIPVISNASKTSLLKLKRFAEDADDSSKEGNARTNDKVIYYEKWFYGVIRLLKENNGVMAVDDLRAELSIIRSQWQVRAFQRCMRRFDASGCVRRIKAKVAGKNDGDRGQYTRAVQLLREPTDADRDMFMTRPKENTLQIKMNLMNQQSKDSDDDDEDDVKLDIVDMSELSAPKQDVPQWTPDLPLPRFLYELIEKSGPEGLSIMALHKLGVGQVYRRPMDDELLRLGDHWQTAQPAHLRHLAIVKDTGSIDKYSFFKYRTYDNFAKAVEQGDAYWESVLNKTNASKKKATKAQPTATLDAYGFPVVPKHRLADHRDGAATLTQAAKSTVSLFANKKDLWTLYIHGKPQSTDASRKRSASIDSERAFRPAKKRRTVTLDISEDVSEFSAMSTPAPDQSAVQAPQSVKESATASVSDFRLAAIDTPRAQSLRALSWPRTKRGRRPKSRMLTIRTQRLLELPWFAQEQIQQSREAAQALLAMSTGVNPLTSKSSDTFMIDPALMSSIHQVELPRPATPTRTPVRSPVIASRLQDLDFTLTSTQSLEERRPYARRKEGLARGQGAVGIKRTQTLLDILRECGGLYPGDREIHVPMAAAFKRLHGTIIDGATVDNTVKNLLSRGKLKKIVFQFHDAKGMQITKHVLTDLSVLSTDPRIKAMQESIREAHPGKYHPPEANLNFEADGTDLDVDKRFPVPWRANGTRRTTNTGADAVNFPLDEDIVVERTVVGLELEEDYRADKLLKNESGGRTPKRKNKKATVPSSSESDGDEPDEIDEAQRTLSHGFQVEGYVHDDKHAFIPRKPKSRLAVRKTSADFFRAPLQPTPVAAVLGSVQEIPAKPIVKHTEYPVASLARSRVMTMSSTQPLHAASGTFPTVSVVSMPAELNMIDIIEQGTSQVRKAPVTRLQSLGSSLFKNRRLLQKPQTLQISNLDRLAELENARAEALGTKRTISEALSEDDDESVIEQTKPKRAYKSLRGAKASLGVDRNDRVSGGIEILEQDDPRLHGPTYAVSRQRDRKTPQQFKESDRLTGAVALYRIVMGAMDQRSNWGVIAHMLSFRYEPDFLRRRWDLVKNGREETIRRVMEQMYDVFLDAYENDNLPRVDFDNLNSVDWPALLKWFENTQQVVTLTHSTSTPELPRSSDVFDTVFEVTETAVIWEHSKEAWFTTPVEKTRRDLAHEFVYGIALPGSRRPTSAFADERIVLRTLIRAVSVTKQENYNIDQAAALFSSFPDELVAATCEEMLTDKTIRHLNKGRQQPGRNYEIHDAHWTLFRRWPGRVNEWQYVRDLAAARQSIIERLNKSDRVYLDFHASDFEIVVFTNLVDQGLVRIVIDLPERNDDFEAPYPKISALGYSDYTYNAKTLDRERLRFPVVYERTSKYHSAHGLVEGVPIPMAAREHDGRLPFWIDIHGNLLPDVWDLVTRSVLQLVVFRTGITTSMMEVCHNHRFMEWEIDLVVDWLEQSGIAVRCGFGSEVDGIWRGGWRASEWWYCAFEPEMAPWKGTS